MCLNFMRNHKKLTLVSGCILALVGILLFSLSSTMIKAIVKAKLVLSPDSVIYDFWKSIPIPIYYSVYLFNITNPDEILNGEKPHFEEIGPYAYKMQQEKENITFHNNGTVSYVQRRIFQFSPEKSGNVNIDDKITHLNMVIFMANEVIKNKNNNEEIFYFTLDAACNTTKFGVNCNKFLQHTVHELLFEGYYDKILDEMANFPIFPSLPFKEFAYFAGRNDTPGSDKHYNVYTGEKDINKLGYLAEWDYQDHLGFYKSGSKCDRFDYSSAGDLRPPYLLKDNNDPIYMFIGDIGRSFRMDYKKEVEVNGISCKRYMADEHFLNYDIEENRCFCSGGQCPPNGVADVSPGALGAPIFLSLPHFLYANEEYKNNVTGLNPSEDKHRFYFDIEPTLAIPMRANARMQINILIERNPLFEQLSDFPFDKIVFPALWLNIGVEIDDDMSSKLKLILKVVPIVLYVISGVLLLTGLIIIYFYYKYSKKSISYNT